MKTKRLKPLRKRFLVLLKFFISDFFIMTKLVQADKKLNSNPYLNVRLDIFQAAIVRKFSNQLISHERKMLT